MAIIQNNDTEQKNEKVINDSLIVKVTRIFNAPIEKVWNAWSNEELVKQWWGPIEFTCPMAKIDFRIGGKYTLAMKDPLGKVIWSSGEYLELSPYKKIVSTDYFSDEYGNFISAKEAGMPGEWPLECIVSVEFCNTHGEQSKITINHQGIPKDMHDDCEKGWNSSINKLQKLLEQI